MQQSGTRFKQISGQQKKLVNSQWRNQDIAEIKLRTNDFKNFCDVLINITTGNVGFSYLLLWKIILKIKNTLVLSKNGYFPNSHRQI